MAKYGGGITLRQQCKYEVAELRAQLVKYGVPEEEIREIAGMVCEGYHHAIQACAGENVVEEKLTEVIGEKELQDFVRPANPDGYLARLWKYQHEHLELFLDGTEEDSTELAK